MAEAALFIFNSVGSVLASMQQDTMALIAFWRAHRLFIKHLRHASDPAFIRRAATGPKSATAEDGDDTAPAVVATPVPAPASASASASAIDPDDAAALATTTDTTTLVDAGEIDDDDEDDDAWLETWYGPLPDMP